MHCPNCGHTFDHATLGVRAGSDAKHIYEQIRDSKSGTVWRASDFSGGRNNRSVYNALWEMVRQGTLEKSGYGRFTRI